MRLLSFLILLLLANSCSRADEKLIQARANLIGEWKVYEQIYAVRSDSIYATYNNTLDLALEKDGTGVQENSNGQILDIEWIYQYDPGMIVITMRQDSFPFPTYDIVFHEVVSNTKDRQLWRRTEEMAGFIEAYEYLWVMHKK